MEFFAVIGLIGSIFSLILRSLFLERYFPLSSRCFWAISLLTLAANLVAFLGFHQLADNPPSPTGDDYHAVLEILSLLSAGAIAGFWALDYQDTYRDETHFLNIISGFFVLAFYALFFFICFYIGKSNDLHNVPLVSWVVPGIMVLLLEINAVIDIWDYRHYFPEDREKKTN